MHITTVHTLSFTIKCVGNDQNLAALAIIRLGATSMNLGTTIGGLTLLDGEDSTTRNSSIQATAEHHETCENYWAEVQRALALIGVEATSP